MAGRLTTHVLNTAQGCPAAQVTIEVWRRNAEDEGYSVLKTVHTNADGRTDDPLLAGEEMVAGMYELVFSVGEYFAAHMGTSTALPFLDRIPVRFGIADATVHYHVPLLVSPWAYSTYRGS
ncbi:MAG: hydroxyisourate hydrolase [Ktedonobacteraceae bacterium]